MRNYLWNKIMILFALLLLLSLGSGCLNYAKAQEAFEIVGGDGEEITYHPQKITQLSGKSKKKKEAELRWAKDPDADFYQIQYSMDKSFKNKKSKKVNGIKCTIKGLGKGKTYYFRVRGYAFAAGYGKWSSKCRVKIKK
jgi:hypothetical protein